ncbi:MAG TPA: hypothetical protein VGP68_15350 [Gemmataceae bacterium]|nr:hypothetical protein [Gemmataceae bacterium]
MGRRIMNRKELRADFDAAERRQTDAEGETEEEVEDEEEDEEGDDAEEAEGDDEVVDEEDEDGAPKKKPKKKKAAPKVAKPKRTRAPKITRMKVVWGVFSNSNQRVAVYEFPKRNEADEHAARLTADKKSTHFVQPVKEPIEEKKEK